MKTIQFLTVILILLLSTQTIFAGRYYDSETGRWLSVDPLADKYPGLSPYNYVENNPLRFIDPDGNNPVDIMVSNPFFAQGFGEGFVNQIGNTISGTWDAVTNPVETFGGIVDAVANSDETIRAIAESEEQIWDDLNSADPSVAGNAAGEIAAGVAEVVVGTKGVTKVKSIVKISKTNKTLAANPFKGKSPKQIGRLLESKGFIKKGQNPVQGKGSYLHPKSGNSYYIDKGGKYKKGIEKPHVDVNRPKGTNETKRKYPLGDNL